jgi:hypothetical protein
MRHRTSITVDGKIWRRFRAVLAMQGKDVSAVLEQLAERYIQEHEAAAREALEHNQEEPR